MAEPRAAKTSPGSSSLFSRGIRLVEARQVVGPGADAAEDHLKEVVVLGEVLCRIMWVLDLHLRFQEEVPSA